MFITVSDIEPIVDILPVAVFTENLSASREVPGSHQGHDGAQHRVGGEKGVLGVEPEAVVGLVAQAHSEPLHGAQLLGQVHTQIKPGGLMIQSVAVSLIIQLKSVPDNINIDSSSRLIVLI